VFSFSSESAALPAGLQNGGQALESKKIGSKQVGDSASVGTVGVAAYLVLFAGVGTVFLLAAMGIGRLLRPAAPTAEKLQTYECGEPAVGDSFVQFDLRFYVVALVFIIFEVEVAFFFPWAAVFGKLARLRAGAELDAAEAAAIQREFGLPMGEGVTAGPSVAATNAKQVETVRRFAMAAMADLAIFFGLLLVGFAYVWKQGDLDWVRARASPPLASGEFAPRTPPVAAHSSPSGEEP
jgi:NADH-quinone oxidoreductase subunit A